MKAITSLKDAVLLSTVPDFLKKYGGKELIADFKIKINNETWNCESVQIIREQVIATCFEGIAIYTVEVNGDELTYELFLAEEDDGSD